MMNVHLVDRSQPFGSLHGPPLGVNNEEFALALGRCGAAPVGLISTHATAVGQLSDVILEPSQVGFHFARSSPSRHQLQALE